MRSMAKSGAWTYGLTYDDPGLERMADADERGGGAALTVAQIYSKRCDRAVSPSFAFGGDDRFVLKGETGSRVADAWLFFAKEEAFESAGRKVRLAMSENDGALYTKLDPAELAANVTLAICPTAKAPGAGKTKCSLFDLSGFARAYDSSARRNRLEARPSPACGRRWPTKSAGFGNRYAPTHLIERSPRMRAFRTTGAASRHCAVAPVSKPRHCERSEAIHSRAVRRRHGLLRRCAPRNDLALL